MNQVAFEIIVIFLLLVANGVFAMAEIAVVSAKKPRLRRLAEQGNGPAWMALDGAVLRAWLWRLALDGEGWRVVAPE